MADWLKGGELIGETIDSAKVQKSESSKGSSPIFRFVLFFEIRALASGTEII